MSLSDLFQQAALVHKEKPAAPQAKRSSIVWTPEQEEVLSSTSDRVLVKALAGTGKTSTLFEYARRRPHKRWQFLVFNRSVSDALQSTCPRNVNIQTVHQLGFSKFAQHVSGKLKERVVAKDLSTLTASFHLTHRLVYAKYLIQSMEYYCHHAVSWDEMQIDPKAQQRFQVTQEQWKSDLQKWWSEGFLEQSSLPLMHDMYVKRLSQSDFSWDGCWMLDEAQDWGESFYQCFAHKTQEHVMVGDPYQTLYRFRHAQGAMPCVEGQQICWLTQSQRQGYGVESVINGYLAQLGCKEKWQGNPSFACALSHAKEDVFHLQEFSPNVFLAYDHQTLEQAKSKYASLGASFMTIHASKGLEFDRVWVLDHVLPFHLSHDERLSLQYVGSTRAKTHLRLPASWMTLNTTSAFDLPPPNLVDWKDVEDTDDFWS